MSVIVTTREEAANLARCLSALERFAEVVVVDSMSQDGTPDIARAFGVRVEQFAWNGRYPKKRQWCLDTLTLAHERVFFVDADEEVTPALCEEIAALDWSLAGYFVKGNYVVNGRELRHGLGNEKLCLFDRRLVAFPVVDDLDAPGMGEIEGHYQPAGRTGTERFGRLASPLRHHASEDVGHYRRRHEAYASWRRAAAHKLPRERRRGRRMLAAIQEMLPFPGIFFAVYYFILRGGILDYPHNLEIFRQKWRYLGYDQQDRRRFRPFRRA